MSETERRLDDIEKRLARLERASDILQRASDILLTSRAAYTASQFCECGRDVCRAPDCPSHKSDPLGR